MATPIHPVTEGKYVTWGSGLNLWHKERTGTKLTECGKKVGVNYRLQVEPPDKSRWCAICYFTEKQQIFNV
jgi:hypothetical protein